MQTQPKGAILLKVMGIIMIVGGAVSVIMSIVLIAAVAYLISMEVQGTGLLIVGIIITILAGVAELIAGIIITKNAKKAEKATKCMVWAIIVLILQLLGTIITIVGSNALVGASVASGGSNVVSIITGMVVPILAIVGAVMNKKSYDASRGVQTSFSSLAGDVVNEVKEMDDDVVGLAKDAKEKAVDVAGDVKEFADKAVDKAGDVVGDVKEKAADVAGDVKEKAADVAGDVKEFADKAIDKAGDVVDDVKDKFDGQD